MRVTWLVSPNGLGHAQRAAAIASALVRRRREAAITLVMQPWQRDRLADRPARLLADAGARFVLGLMDAAPRWPVVEAGRDLLVWRDEVAASGVLDDADLVVSDNLGGALAIAPEAVLCGSFLWSDLLAPLAASSREVARFVEDERALLARHRPLMICDRDLVMPGVVAQTRAAALPWLVTPTPVSEVIPDDFVALLGGASGAADDALLGVARALAARGIPLALSSDLARREGAPAARPFDHAPSSYAAARLLVCRPGLGTLTQAISAGRPLAIPPELDHAEMVHNAARMCELGVGRMMPAATDAHACAEAIHALFDDREALTAMSRAASTRPRGGLAAAAELLVEELERREARSCASSA